MIHPGVYVRTLFPVAFSVTETAERLGVSRCALSKLFHGRSSMSCRMAVRLEEEFEIHADGLMRMQADYDLAQYRSSL